MTLLEYQNNAKKKNIEDKIPDITNLATKTTLNAKINEVKGEIPNITNLATTSALTAVENKIPSVSNLVKKTDYNTKINEIEKKITDHNHDKYITTPEFKEVWFNCSVHRSAHLFIIEISSHSDIKWKQPQRIFLQYSWSVTMINIMKNICEGKFMN